MKDIERSLEDLVCIEKPGSGESFLKKIRLMELLCKRKKAQKFPGKKTAQTENSQWVYESERRSSHSPLPWASDPASPGSHPGPPVSPMPPVTATSSTQPAVTQPWHQKDWCLELGLHHCDMAIFHCSRERKKLMNNHYSKIWATSNAREEN